MGLEGAGEALREGDEPPPQCYFISPAHLIFNPQEVLFAHNYVYNL